MKRICIALLFLTILGCATAYKPSGFSGGFSETRISENAFRVSFRGNGYTSEERSADFSLLRAAELTLENQFRYFVIINVDDKSDISIHTDPVQTHTTAQGYSVSTTTTGGDIYAISRPRSINTILCFKEKPQTKGFVLDAVFVSKSIRGKYGMIQENEVSK